MLQLFRLPLRFSIRSLLIAISLVCCVLGVGAAWLGPRWKRQQALDRLLAADATIAFADNSLIEGRETKPAASPTLVRAALGTDAKATQVTLGQGKVTKETLNELANYPTITCLCLTGAKLPPGGLEVLEKLPNLQWLDLIETSINDDDVPAILRCPSICRLNISGTQITNDGFRRLAAMPNIQGICIHSFHSNQGPTTLIDRELWLHTSHIPCLVLAIRDEKTLVRRFQDSEELGSYVLVSDLARQCFWELMNGTGEASFESNAVYGLLRAARWTDIEEFIGPLTNSSKKHIRRKVYETAAENIRYTEFATDRAKWLALLRDSGLQDPSPENVDRCVELLLPRLNGFDDPAVPAIRRAAELHGLLHRLDELPVKKVSANPAESRPVSPTLPLDPFG